MRKLRIALALGAAISMFMGFNAYAENYWWVNGVGQWGYMAGGEELRDGWFWIDGNRDGSAECYYFQSYSILTDTVTPDGYQVDGEGAWIVDGVVQTCRTDEVAGVYVSSYALDTGKANPDTPIGRIPLAENGLASNKSVGRSEQRGWVQDQGWRYVRDNGTYITSDWAWIDGKCYCFDINGEMYENTTTPDGFQVNGLGQWVVDGAVQSKN